MGTATFTITDVTPLLDHTEAAPRHRILYEQPDSEAPGLWLVGDQGVYLMSNGSPHLSLSPGAKKNHHRVAYAKGTNPDGKGDWYEAKRAIFGGDDGSDWISADAFRSTIANATKRGAKTIAIRITAQTMDLIG